MNKTNSTVKSAARKGYVGLPINETVNNGFFTVDHHWTVQYWNKAAEELLGVSATNILGKNLWEQFAGIIPLNFYIVYHKAFLQDIPIHFEEYWAEMDAWFDVITYHSDELLSVSFKSSKTPCRPGQPAHPQQQLRIFNELYKYVTQVTNDCLWEWDLPNRQLFWIDGGHKRVFGYDIENALIPQSFWESRIHPQDRDKLLLRLAAFLTGEPDTEWEEEYRFQRANGEYAHVCDRGHLLFDGGNVPLRMIGSTQDITKRKLTELRLLESEQKLSLIARQTVNAVLITDLDEKITWVNSAFTRITGYEAEEVMGRKPGELLQGKDTDPATVVYLHQQIQHQQPFDCDILNYTKSRHPYWIHIQGQPIFDNQGKCDRFFAMQTDITERMSLENLLSAERISKQKEITNAAITAQENERASIGREMHDNLNQILGAAKLYIELAKVDEEHRQMCLDKSLDYIGNVIQEIRKISKTLVTPVLVMGLTDGIKMLIEDLRLTNPLILSLQTESMNESRLDKKLQLDLFRMIQEQVNNILKHAAATYAAIHLRQTARDITLKITDNGKGCDLSIIPTGVGVINLRTRTELAGGTVNIISAPGQGYRTTIVLPL